MLVGVLTEPRGGQGSGGENELLLVTPFLFSYRLVLTIASFFVPYLWVKQSSGKMTGSLTPHLSLSRVHCHQTDEKEGKGSVSRAC